MTAELGQRLKSVRKRRALTQKELAQLSGLSVQRIQQLEQLENQGVRLATLRKLAIALGVRTSVLQPGGATDTEHANPATESLWEPVRRALVAPGEVSRDEDEPPSIEDVETSYRALAPLVEAYRYRDIAAVLPGLLADARNLDDKGRAIRARLLSLAAFLLVSNRQFDTAALTVDQAVDIAPEQEIAVGAVNSLVWSHLRQGNLDAARELAVKWADDLEPPRFSKASPTHLAAWGRFWMYLAHIGVRDNSPGGTADALALARAAAVRIGSEIVYDRVPNRTFGPVTVAQASVECAVITEEPARALAIAESLPAALSANTGNRLRHRLDVANAHTQLRQYGEAIGTLREVRATAPEWLAQQRYARDILGTVVSERRTLTDEMRDLADFVSLEY
ncbi:helix-turn-helix transcriptional regulator [Nocardia sp. NPDC050697]|uniref:helix-turn-helix domain-containing protein n=1 Tax=Nocardia sp. NPDC050697 TaxID=3155158 RepID=UPI0033F57931